MRRLGVTPSEEVPLRRIVRAGFGVVWLSLVAAGPDAPTTGASAPMEPVKSNADFHAAITRAGKVHAGHVIRVERGIDFYADKGWADAGLRLYVTLDSNGTESERPWQDISTIDIKYGGRPDVSCSYDSDVTPWMYTCTLKTTASVKTVDGKAYSAVSRHLWKFYYDDGTSETFTLNKAFARAQDTQETDDENNGMYAPLQAEVLKGVENDVTKIVITK
jgi:hypothetical protein